MMSAAPRNRGRVSPPAAPTLAKMPTRFAAQLLTLAPAPATGIPCSEPAKCGPEDSDHDRRICRLESA